MDLVIVGMTAAAAAAATAASQRGQRVLVVGESKDASYCLGLDGWRERVSMLAGFEVVSVDGISAVESCSSPARSKPAALIGINTGAILVTTALASGVVAPIVRCQVDQNIPD